MHLVVDLTAPHDPTQLNHTLFISSITFIATAQGIMSQMKSMLGYSTFLMEHPLVKTHISLKSFQNSDLATAHSAAVGGTFDHLHIGHYLLLLHAILIAEKELYIGITGDALLGKKSNRLLLQPYEIRKDKVVEFVKKIKPELILFPHELHEPCGMATLVQHLETIVVSEQTVSGAEMINKVREEKHFPSLKLVVCPIISQTGSIKDKMSSSMIRQNLLSKNHWNLANYEEYHARWKATMGRLVGLSKNDNPRQNLSQKWFQEIFSRYSEYWRYYHTNQHIITLLRKISPKQLTPLELTALEISIFFHDIVYRPDSNHNQDDSSQMCSAFLTDLLKDQADSETLKQLISLTDLLIMETKTHVSTTALSQMLYDVDMGILDSEQQQYQIYAQAIKLEYFPLFGESYKQKRIDFLRKALSSNPKYSFEAKNYFENIRRQIDDLNQL